MSKKEKVWAQLDGDVSAENPEAMYADGFDEAILGICRRANIAVVAYDQEACLKILMERDGMTREEAVEFFDFNVLGAWMGENTPVFIERYE